MPAKPTLFSKSSKAMSNFKLTLAANGARRQKSDHRLLPITPDETAATAARCFAAGAHEIHLHVRDKAGRHSLDAGRYREAIAAVTTAAPGMAIQITTESAGMFTVADQYACLSELRPVAASVSIREMAADPAIAAKLYALADEAGTRIQHILYGPTCLAQLEEWQCHKTIPRHMTDVILVLGQYSPPVIAQPDMLGKFSAVTGGDKYRWTACAFGQHESDCLLAALKMGGNVRLGFENNIQRPDGTIAQDNESLVADFVSIAADSGYSLWPNLA